MHDHDAPQGPVQRPTRLTADQLDAGMVLGDGRVVRMAIPVGDEMILIFSDDTKVREYGSTVYAIRGEV